MMKNRKFIMNRSQLLLLGLDVVMFSTFWIMFSFMANMLLGLVAAAVIVGGNYLTIYYLKKFKMQEAAKVAEAEKLENDENLKMQSM